MFASGATVPSRRRARGVTLIEVMVVVVILGRMASAVAIALFPEHRRAQIRMTRISAATMRTAASGWRMEREGDPCPTPEPLRTAQRIDAVEAHGRLGHGHPTS